jgi:uncharacterized protein YcbX
VTGALRVTALALYPVKSLAGVALDSCPVDARGLRGDRRWGIVDASGTKVTAREVKALLGLRAEPADAASPHPVPADSVPADSVPADVSATTSIRIVDREGDVLEVRQPLRAEPIPVSHTGQSTALPAGPVADEWLSERLGVSVRLVWQDETARRPVKRELGGRPGDTNSLSDAAPILLTTDASLDRLNGWLGEGGSDPIGHDRFRPNVVVDGKVPFAEDGWDEVRIGTVTLRRTMVCDRCVMTTIDRSTLESAKEPIRTLARHRRWDGATWFGIRLTPVIPVDHDAAIAVGDRVLVAPVRASAGP